MPDLSLWLWIVGYFVVVILILALLFGRPEPEPVAPTRIEVDYPYTFEAAELVRIDGRLLWIHDVGPTWIVVASWPPDA